MQKRLFSSLILTLAPAVILPGVFPGVAVGQSSSLYVNDPAAQQSDPFATVVIGEQGQVGVRSALRQDPISPELRRSSLMAVAVPEPRTYQVEDLVTIIVRESTTATIDASIETEKDNEWTGEIAELPKLNLADLLDLQLKPNTFVDGTPKLDVKVGSKFEGEGDYERSNEMTARLAARVVDVKPNGLLVLEARKFIENDDEKMTLIVTGTCSVDSISADNTVLSSDIYDLFVSQQHTGELRKSTKKGWLSKLMDFVFNF